MYSIVQLEGKTTVRPYGKREERKGVKEIYGTAAIYSIGH
jgi:hypothetical protein